MNEQLSKHHVSPSQWHNLVRGVGLVELLIALLLGLITTGAVVNIFIVNQHTFRSVEQLARMQENARTAFELMARSLREAGGTNCGRGLPTVNVINNAATTWWADWNTGLRGYDGDQEVPAATFGDNAEQRIEGTDAFFSIYADGNTGGAIITHNPDSAQFTLASANHRLQAGHLALACDYRRAALFQITSTTDYTVSHATNGPLPGNCNIGLGANCESDVNKYTFQSGGVLNGVISETWYIGANGRGGRSLYRARVTRDANGNAIVQIEEIVEGLEDMQLTYLQMNADGTLPSDYERAGNNINWARVVAVRIVLTARSVEPVGTDGTRLERRFYHVVSLRNRLS